MLREVAPATAALPLRHLLADLFLPAGYPESVSGDYLAYQTWDTAQAFCSAVVGQLATRAVLQGVGVGDDAASPLAAALTWTLRDGAGMLGRITFAWAGAASLDNDPRFWRLVADVLNDGALLLDLLSPGLPRGLLLPVLCVSSLLKSVVGVAGGATRVALTQHQARRNNAADVAAKDGSQETAVNLVALVVGLLLLPLLESAGASWVWAVYVAATAGHVVCNYRAVKAVVMETFNEQRVEIVVAEMLRAGRVLRPGEVAQRERLIYRRRAIVVGARAADVAEPEPAEMTRLANLYGAPFLLGLARHGRGVAVLLAKGRDDAGTLVQAVFAAHLAIELHTRSPHRAGAIIAAEALDLARPERLTQRLRSAGWNVASCNFHCGEWRVEW